MQEVIDWLNGSRDYEPGRALYERYGSSNFLKGLFKSGNTPFNVQKLVSAMQDLSDSVGSPAEPDTVEELPPAVPEPSATQQAQNHKRFLYLTDKRNELVRKLDRLMAMLDLSEDREVLHDAARQILTLNRQKQEIWSLIDYYNSQGRFPDEEFKEEKEQSDDIKKQLIYQSICKARKRLEKPDCKTPEKTRALIDKKLKELENMKGKRDE